MKSITVETILLALADDSKMYEILKNDLFFCDPVQGTYETILSWRLEKEQVLAITTKDGSYNLSPKSLLFFNERKYGISTLLASYNLRRVSDAMCRL